MFAWSISTSSPGWVDHKFVFFGTAFSMVIVSILAWTTITDENMTHKERESWVDSVVVRGRDNEQGDVGCLDPVACPGKKADMV